MHDANVSNRTDSRGPWLMRQAKFRKELARDPESARSRLTEALGTSLTAPRRDLDREW